MKWGKCLHIPSQIAFNCHVLEEDNLEIKCSKRTGIYEFKGCMNLDVKKEDNI